MTKRLERSTIVNISQESAKKAVQKWGNIMRKDVKEQREKEPEEQDRRNLFKAGLWGLTAVLVFIVIVHICKNLNVVSPGGNAGGKKPSDNNVRSSQESNQDEPLGVVPSSETFYVNLSDERTLLSLASLGGQAGEKLINMIVAYHVEQEAICFYAVDKEILQYACRLEEGQAYSICVEEKDGGVSIKKGDTTLCYVAVSPSETCKWNSITIDDNAMAPSENTQSSAPGTEDSSTEPPTGSEGSTESGTTESTGETNEEPASQSQSSSESAKDKLEYKGLLRDIFIAAIAVAAVTLALLAGIIALAKQANPFPIIVNTIRMSRSSSAARKNGMDSEADDSEEEQEADDEEAAEESDYEEDDDYEDEDDYDDDYEDEDDRDET